MFYYVYVISSIPKKYIYTGLTSNLEERLLRHNKGQNKTTKPYAPFKLIHTEKYSTRNESRHREKYLKSGAGREFIKSIIDDSR